MDVAVGLRSVAVPSPPGWRALNPLSVAYPTLSDALLSADWLLEEDDVVSAPRSTPPPPEARTSTVADSAPAAAWLSAPPSPAAPWRCLDPAHAASCTRCAHQSRTARIVAR